MTASRKILLFSAAATLAAALCAGPASAAPVGPSITVTPWLAPNVFGSPSYADAVANQEHALTNGLTSYGTPGTPTYYQAQDTVTAQQAIVTGFPSWLGQADPGTVYGPAFASELGNRMLFGLEINGNGQQFSISELGFSATSTDPSNALAFAFGAGSYNYSSDYIGIDKGADGLLFTSDDVLITSGAPDQLVDALIGRGSGNSLAAYCPGCSLADEQAAIDAVAAYPGTDFDFTGTYTLSSVAGALDATGSGTFHILAATTGVPEPSTIALLGGGMMALFGFAARRRRG